MKKCKKVSMIIIPIVIFILILFAPIPKKFSIAEGSAFTLNSLTYKVVLWNMFEQSDKPYNKTEVLFLPQNFSDTESIWYEKENDLRNEGYGAITGIFKVTEIQEKQIIIAEVSNNKNAINNCCLTEIDFKNYSNISFNEITLNTAFKISYDGFVLETSPCMLGRIYKIEPIDKKITITGTMPDNTSSTESQTSEENIPEKDTSSTEDISSQQTSSKPKPSMPIVTQDENIPPNFWQQKMHWYDKHYDKISNMYIPYRIIEPADYDPNKKYPVILYLHGAGERFNSINDWEVNDKQIEILCKAFPKAYPWMQQALIIAPQISINDWWSFGANSDGALDAAMRIFEDVTSIYSCDDSRYYVTGISMGGIGTWSVAAKYSEIFAAAMPLCGFYSSESAPLLTDIPIRIIHGTNDGTLPYGNSKMMYEAIKAAGGKKAVLSLYEGVDHDVWNYAYDESETWEWLFAQQKT